MWSRLQSECEVLTSENKPETVTAETLVFTAECYTASVFGVIML